MYCCAGAAIHRRAPSGFFRLRLRCSAPRTAPSTSGANAVHPWTALNCGIGRCASDLLLAWALCFCFVLSTAAGYVRHRPLPLLGSSFRRKPESILIFRSSKRRAPSRLRRAGYFRYEWLAPSFFLARHSGESRNPALALLSYVLSAELRLACGEPVTFWQLPQKVTKKV